MKILRAVYDWPPPWNGLAPAPYFMSKAQGKLGHDVTVLTGGLNGKKIKSRKFVEYQEENVKVMNLPRALSKHTGPFLTTCPSVLFIYLWRKIVKRNIDIVHGHGHVMLWFNIYKLLFGWLDKTPYVAHFHIVSRERVQKAKERNEKMKFLQRFFENPLWDLSDRTGVKAANACIFVSETNLDKMHEIYKPDRKKLFLVESGFEPDIFFADKSRQLGLQKEILCVGTISPRKGPDLIIESLKYLPSEYQLRWVGTAEDEKYFAEVKEVAENLGLTHKVIWEGYVKNFDLASYYKEAAIFALASQSEGLPKVVIEALACGTPVIASGFRASKDITGLNYFTSLAPKTIAKEIKEVIDQTQVVDIKMIHSQYSWNTKAKEVEDVYKFVLNNSKK